jgi:hypothetical protein
MNHSSWFLFIFVLGNLEMGIGMGSGNILPILLFGKKVVKERSLGSEAGTVLG